MTHDPRAIANALLSLQRDDMPDNVLHNLLFLVQGWALAIRKAPLFEERFIAADSGPMLLSLKNEHSLRLHDAPRLFICAQKHPVLCVGETHLIERVWKRYRDATPSNLSFMVQKEGTPWSNTYFGQKRDAFILHVEMTDYFTRLALAGRAQATG